MAEPEEASTSSTWERMQEAAYGLAVIAGLIWTAGFLWTGIGDGRWEYLWWQEPDDPATVPVSTLLGDTPTSTVAPPSVPPRQLIPPPQFAPPSPPITQPAAPSTTGYFDRMEERRDRRERERQIEEQERRLDEVERCLDYGDPWCPP